MSKVRGQPRPARRGAAVVLLALLAIAGFAACLGAAAWPRRWPAVWAGRWPRGTLAIGAAVLGLVPGAAVVWPAAGGGLAPLPGEASVRLALVVAAAVALVAGVFAADPMAHISRGCSETCGP